MLSRLAFLCFFALLNAGQTQPSTVEEEISRFYFGIFGGYGAIDGALNNEGQYTQYRLSLGVDAYKMEKLPICFGLEAAVQSGNFMALDANWVSGTSALSPESILKPFMDFLVAVNYNFYEKWDLIAKGGFAYRQLQLTDRHSSADYLAKVNGEFQAGIGYQITKQTRIVALYQGIYSTSDAGTYLTSNDCTGIVHIPTQQAGLIGFDYNF